MSQNRRSRLAPLSDGDRSLRDRMNQNHLNGLATVLAGMSQLSLAVMFADVTGDDISLFIGGAGGWLLIGIGVNVFQGKEVFDDGWVESKRVTWLLTAVQFILAVAVVAATVWILISYLSRNWSWTL
jgi:hypothetical protein